MVEVVESYLLIYRNFSFKLIIASFNTPLSKIYTARNVQRNVGMLLNLYF